MKFLSAEKWKKNNEIFLLFCRNCISGTNDSFVICNIDNIAQSIEDLYILHDQEIKLLEKVLHHISSDYLDSLLSEDGYSTSIIRNTIVKHPVDNYNLLKRTSLTWRKVKEKVVSDEVSISV